MPGCVERRCWANLLRAPGMGRTDPTSRSTRVFEGSFFHSDWPLSTVQSTTTIDLDRRRFWETVLDTIDVVIRILGRTMASTEGRKFIYPLGPGDARLRLELFDRVSCCHPSFHDL